MRTQVLVALCGLSSPLGVLRLVLILTTVPYHMARAVLRSVAPALFMKSLDGEIILITVSGCPFPFAPNAFLRTLFLRCGERGCKLKWEIRMGCQPLCADPSLRALVTDSTAA